MASEDDHLHLSCESSDSKEDKTLPENASKQYGLQSYQFEPYTAENRSTDDSSDQEETPVNCEHGSRLDCIEWWAFLLLLSLLLFSLSFFGEKYLGTYTYHPNHSNRVMYNSEWRQHLEMGEYTIDLFADISTWVACTETRSRSNNVWQGVYAQ